MRITLADKYFMEQALALAKQAYARKEVPVGAVVVYQGNIVSAAHNQVEQQGDATAHAELLALQAACAKLKTKYLTEATLYSTLEPCHMCAGAMYWLQLDRVVYGAHDPKRGYTLCQQGLHPRTHVCHGILASESQKLLQDFFRALR